MRFRDIPQFPRAGYKVDVAWSYLERHLEHYSGREDIPFNMLPDYQRGHVWKEEQQIAFVEYGLMGGENSMVITTNCPNWMSVGEEAGPYELVDGLQRLTAVLRFTRGEIRAFGHYIGEYEDKLKWAGGPSFSWRVCTLPTRKEVLQLYLLINSGGVVHSPSEIKRVKRLLQTELKGSQ
jgi:hypothetical protein